MVMNELLFGGVIEATQAANVPALQFVNAKTNVQCKMQFADTIAGPAQSPEVPLRLCVSVLSTLHPSSPTSSEAWSWPQTLPGPTNRRAPHLTRWSSCVFRPVKSAALLRKPRILRIPCGENVGNQVEQFILVQRVDESGRHHAHRLRLPALHFIRRHLGQ